MSRCRYSWWSQRLGQVRCWLEQDHPGHHQAWRSRHERRTWPDGASWVARGYELSAPSGRWLDA